MRMTSFLQRDRYASLVRRLKALRVDYGPAFDTSLQVGEVSSKLTIRSCPYHRIFEIEELPQLLSCCCCSQDAMWFHDEKKPVPVDHKFHDSTAFVPFTPHKRQAACAAGLVSSMADGQSTECRFVVRKDFT